MNGPGTDPLLLGLAAGDPRAFAALYDRYAVRLYRAACGILGSREDAEDVVQEVFLAAVRSHERLGDVRDLTAYLFTAMSRAATRCAMRRTRTLQASRGAANEAAAALKRAPAESPDWHRLQQALGLLPSPQREVITLKIDGELTFAQIAQVLGVSINTAASRYRYALQKLKAFLMEKSTSQEARQ